MRRLDSTLFLNANFPSSSIYGQIVSLKGPILLATIPLAAIGDLCYILPSHQPPIPAQVISFQEELFMLAPLDDIHGISPGTSIKNTQSGISIKVSDNLIGKVIDSLGRDLTTTPSQHLFHSRQHILLTQSPPPALSREPINTVLSTGIRTLDAFCTIGHGQRVGLFSGAGVGKSTLLGMIARNANVDINVIALVGERGREVNDFISQNLKEGGLARSIVIVSSSDESPLRRVLAVLSATTIAEYFRAKQKRVLLLVDSLTRVARAMRDLGLACGELPVRHGFPPSVFTRLPRILERPGNVGGGSITAIYTMLSTSEYELDPLAEEVKSLLDGHIMLKDTLAQEGIQPAIDPLTSVSRLFSRLQEKESLENILILKRALSRLKRDKDIVLLGGQADRELQVCMDMEAQLRYFMIQGEDECFSFEQTNFMIGKLAGMYREGMRKTCGIAL